jgi:uncharacterized protein (DUF433 family)
MMVRQGKMATRQVLPIAIGLGMAANVISNNAIPMSGGSGESVNAQSGNLYWISADSAEDRISCLPDVCGGDARIRGTRITVWGLEDARRIGIPDNTILEMYPALTHEDLRAAWKYVENNREEINDLIASNHDA